MATTTTSFAPAATIKPFSGLDKIGNPYRAIQVPRAEVLFKIFNEAYLVAESAEFQRITVTCVLPVNFSYVLADFSSRIIAIDAEEWAAQGSLNLDDSDSTDRTFGFSQEVISNGPIDDLGTNATKVRAFCPCGPFLRAMLQSPLGSGAAPPRLFHALSNPVADGAAGTFTMYARFLQYDIEQTTHVEVNTPTLIR